MTESETKALLLELSNPDANRRLDATMKLGQPGWNFAVPELMRLAKEDVDHRVRKASIDALGKIGDQRAYRLLEAIWKDPNEPHDIRNEALQACDLLDGLDESADDADGSGPATGSGDSEFGGL